MRLQHVDQGFGLDPYNLPDLSEVEDRSVNFHLLTIRVSLIVQSWYRRQVVPSATSLVQYNGQLVPRVVFSSYTRYRW